MAKDLKANQIILDKLLTDLNDTDTVCKLHTQEPVLFDSFLQAWDPGLPKPGGEEEVYFTSTFFQVA